MEDLQTKSSKTLNPSQNSSQNSFTSNAQTQYSPDELKKNFKTWISNQKDILVNDGIDIFHEFGEGNHGVLATRNISKGEILVTIPFSSTLSPLSVQIEKSSQTKNSNSDSLIEYLKSNDPVPSDWLAMVLILMHHLSGTTKLKPYIDILPKTFSTPLFFNSTELELLKGTSLEYLLSASPVDEKKFNEVAYEIIKQNPTFWSKETSTLEAFKIAVSIVMSRAFHLNKSQKKEGPYIIPVCDMFNHSTKPSAVVEWNDEYFFMKANQNIKKNSEIFASYGELSNAELLQTYGFVEGDFNIYDYVMIPIDMLFQVCEELEIIDDSFELRRDMIEKLLSPYITHPNLLTGEKQEYFIISKEDLLPENLLHTLAIILMAERSLQQIKDNSIDLQEFMENADESFIGDVYQLALQIVNSKLKKYPTSLREDVQKIQEKDIFLHSKLILNLSIIEKKILEDLKKQLEIELLAIHQNETEHSPNNEEEKEENNFDINNSKEEINAKEEEEEEGEEEEEIQQPKKKKKKFNPNKQRQQDQKKKNKKKH